LCVIYKPRKLGGPGSLGGGGAVAPKNLGQNMISKYKLQQHIFYQPLYITFNL
jgi:hypothetical protein